MRPTAEEIERIRAMWKEPETHEYWPEYHVQKDIWALLAEIDALREENERLREKAWNPDLPLSGL